MHLHILFYQPFVVFIERLSPKNRTTDSLRIETSYNPTGVVCLVVKENMKREKGEEYKKREIKEK
jgi:hypothetical protein